MIRLALFIVAVIWLPMLITAPVETLPPTEPIVLDIPGFVDGVNFTGPQIIKDSAGVIWAATRASSAQGGVVWRVDGYVDADHRGTPTQVFPSDPTRFFANGELIVFPDGYLYYISIQIDNLQNRQALAQTAWPVPGWSP